MDKTHPWKKIQIPFSSKQRGGVIARRVMAHRVIAHTTKMVDFGKMSSKSFL